ncbi:MAG: hypothetical protein LBS21_06835 [Clostridiales bacterium]|jgi:hypothetical protein|nr:hypothetical protein [Clostridiales bacterium]
MAWIESHQELGRHPKTKRLARALQISLPAAVGHLTYLWWWATDYAQNGELTNYTAEDIADASLWEGDASEFVNALVTAQFVDRDETGTHIHDWYDYAGRLIEQRNNNRERMRRARAAKNQDEAEYVPETCANGARTVQARFSESGEPFRATQPNLTIPNQTQPDLTKQDQTTTEPAATGSGASPTPVPYKKIMEAYNSICTRLRKIKIIDGKRQDAVSARFKTYGFDALITVFKKAEASEFLCGNGGRNWSADFDWLMSATNIAKVLEGKYDNAQIRAAPTGARDKPNTMDVLNRIIAESEGGGANGSDTG